MPESVTFEELLKKLNGWDGYGGKGSWEDILFDVGIEGYDPIHEEMVDQRRWFVTYEYVYEYQGRFLAISVDRGATEYQEDGESVHAYEVQKVTKKVVDYIPIPKAQAKEG